MYCDADAPLSICKAGRPASLEYRPQIDGLRAVAVGLVIISHYFHFSKIPLGYWGVSLFFVISGFLITRILLIHKANATTDRSYFELIKNFYIRRGLRIYPLYYFVIILIFSIACLTQFNLFGIFDRIWWLVFYVINVQIFSDGVWADPFSHFWSLAVEEQFYLFWPFLILFVPEKKIFAVILIFILVGPLSRVLTMYLGYERNGILLSAVFDALCIGALFGWMTLADEGCSKLKWLKTRRALLDITAIVVATAIFGFAFLMAGERESFPYVYNVVMRTGSALIFGWLVFRAYEGIDLLKPLLENRRLVYLGRISYGLYVYHAFVPHLIIYLDRAIAPQKSIYSLYLWDQQALHAVSFIATFTLAALSWTLMERPINRLKTRFSEGLGSHV